jgi:alkylation response protein AidB-like acyl-CoA dehydrogenase
MDFRYTDEQLGLRETLQRWISRDYGFEQRRALSRSPLGYSSEAWSHLADLGLLALPFPEEFGGLGGSHVDLMVVREQMGQGLLLEPYWSTVVLCGGLIRDSASKMVQQRVLPEIVAGRLKLALATYEESGRYDLSHVECTASRGDGGWTLSGGKTAVLDWYSFRLVLRAV